MRPLTTMSLLSLLFSLPLYAKEIPSTTSTTIQVPAPISKGEILPMQKSEPIVLQTSISTAQQPILQELIAQVKSAPNKQKRVLMNQLKVHLKTMNKENRQKTMIELRKSFAQKGIQPKIQHQKQANHKTSQHANHQPKFRHLQQGIRNGSGSHRGEGQRGQGGGSGHQGNGQK